MRVIVGIVICWFKSLCLLRCICVWRNINNNYNVVGDNDDHNDGRSNMNCYDSCMIGIIGIC